MALQLISSEGFLSGCWVHCKDGVRPIETSCTLAHSLIGKRGVEREIVTQTIQRLIVSGPDFLLRCPRTERI